MKKYELSELQTIAKKAIMGEEIYSTDNIVVYKNEQYVSMRIQPLEVNLSLEERLEILHDEYVFGDYDFLLFYPNGRIAFSNGDEITEYTLIEG